MKQIVAILVAAATLVAADESVAPLGTYTPAERRHWAFQPRKDTPPPSFTLAADKAWVKTPIDPFVLAKLKNAGLKPAPQADRATLIRRVTYDLHGLPPTPEEIDAFANDPDPNAYEKLIDRLLASPRYGERWGRHWLDVVHYGDTHGYDKDKRRDHAWPYRDYVIRSFNADKPYARFVREQLAGDVLYPGDPDGVVATGFIAAGPWDFVGHVELREGTVEKEKTRLLDRDDMVMSTAATFFSLTVGCARCHDHKFDPIPQKDYYRLQAVFAGVERGNRPCAVDQKRQAEKVILGEDINRLRDEIARSAAREAALRKRPEALALSGQVYAVVPRPPRAIRVLHRGNVEQPRAPVSPGGLSCVSALDPDFRPARPEDEGARRAALASWIADPRNPL